MAKRFGRNQRRKLRQENEALAGYLRVAIDRKVAVEEANHALERRLIDWADEVLHLCGDCSAYNETLRQMLRLDDRPSYDVPLLPTSLPSCAVASRHSYLPESTVAMRTIEAFVYTMTMRPEAIPPRLHFALVSKAGPIVAYAVDRQLFLNPSPRMVGDMALRIARDMAAYLRGQNRAAA